MNNFLHCKRSNDEYSENLLWRQNLLSVFERLGEKDQTLHSMQYLISQLNELNNLNQLQFFMDCILENSEQFNQLGKKEVIKLLGTVISLFKNKLSPFLTKIISFIVKRLSEPPSSGLLELTLETLGISCNNITIDQKHLFKIYGNSGGGGSSGITNNTTNSLGINPTYQQQQQQLILSTSLIDVYIHPIISLINQPSRHIQCASILAIQKVIENIYDINSLLRPQLPKILSQLFKKLINTQLPSPTINGGGGSASMSSFSSQYCIPHILSTIASLFKTVGSNYFLYHNTLSNILIDQINGNLISNAIRILDSNDWSARNSSATLLSTIVEILPKQYYYSRINDILKSLNDHKYDKIKSIRDSVNKSIQLYNETIFDNNSDDNNNSNSENDNNNNNFEPLPSLPITPPYIEEKFKQQQQQQQLKQEQHYQYQQNNNHHSVFSSPSLKSPRKISPTPSTPNSTPPITSQLNPYKKYTPLSSPSLNSTNTTTSNNNNHYHSNNNSNNIKKTTFSSISSSSSSSSSSLLSSSSSINNHNNNNNISTSTTTTNSNIPFAFKTSPTPSYSNSPILKSSNNQQSQQQTTTTTTTSTTHNKNSSNSKQLPNFNISSLSTSPLIFSNNNKEHQHQQQQHIQQQQQQQQQQQHYIYTNEEINDHESGNNDDNENDEDDNILTLSSLSTNNNNKPKPMIFSPSSKIKTTTTTNNNNNNNSPSSSPSSPNLNNIKPKETITTTTTITTDENETLKLIHEMMNSMNDFMTETRENIDQIKRRLGVVESSVLTLQKYYLTK